MCRFSFHPLSLCLTLLFLLYIYLKFKPVTLCFHILTILLFSMVYTGTEKHNQSNLTEGEYLTLGEIISIPEIDGNQLKGLIKNETKEKLIYRHTIETIQQKEVLKKLKPGDLCTFHGELRTPKAATMPNAFNYKQYLHDQHIHWQFKIEKIERCHSPAQFNIETFLLHIRLNSLELIERHFPPSSEGIVQALLFGERQLIDEEVEKGYQSLGIVHLLAISGLHVALLVGGVYYVIIYCGVTHERAMLIFLVLLPIYMVITGGSPSVIRASFMVILYFLIKMFRLKVPPVDVISFTCLFLLFLNPYYLFHVGFQLSYVVSLGLLLSAKLIGQYKSFLAKLTIVSTVAQLFSIPLLLYHFFEVSLISLPLNIIFVPFYSFLILPLSIVATFLIAVIPPLGTFFVTLLDIILSKSHLFVLNVLKLPFSTLVTGRPSVIFILLYCLGTYFLLLRIEQKFPLIKVCHCVAFLVILFIGQVFSPYVNPNGKVMFIDVGQGDSVLIQLPFNKGVFLIDTGGRISFPQEKWEKTKNAYSLVENITIPYLKSIGITKINGLFLTHGDVDHIGEAVGLMNQIKVDELVVPEGFVRGDIEKEVIKKAKENNTKIQVVRSGNQLTYKDLPFYILSPQELTDSKNDDSLVLWTELGGLKWLFTGDAEHSSEEKIIRKYPRLQAEVLKVGHHGSKGSTSEQFLDTLTPSVAVISAGYNNRYQHPHPEVITKLKSRDITILRTDLHGGILYNFKGTSGTFSIHPPYDEVK
ncbi:DNA internalization-related competence protein ComEC/Rec2 [Metabacillus schmidteae]|uniref:DNA internalization-related competence protein ComEC/Rec2 n=1 Tax=Metabacillus schmidteae TaxID=2730405 RepID=UPI001F193004|nr:DNA internalization-related competence protein ComEC/Rec2 [Metabacillus schmidteae]